MRSSPSPKFARHTNRADPLLLAIMSSMMSFSRSRKYTQNITARPMSHTTVTTGRDNTIEYFFRAGDTLIRKKVDFYLMVHTGGELKPQLSEVDDVEWVELSEAIHRASFPSEKKLLEAAQQELEVSGKPS